MNLTQPSNNATQAIFPFTNERGSKNLNESLKKLDHSQTAILIDMSSVDHFNAGGLGRLLRMHRSVAILGKRLELVNASHQVIMFLELTQADQLFNFTWDQNLKSAYAA